MWNISSSQHDYPENPSSMENWNPWGNTSTEDLYPVEAGLKVMRGYDAKPGEFPHQVYLSQKKNGKEIMCSASIIHPLFLLTAAHCVLNMTPATIDLVTGEYDLSMTDGTEQHPNVSSIIVHEKYNARTHANDIAILVLQSAIKLDNFTSVIKIPTPDQILPDWAHVSGWGSTGNGWTSDVLQKAKLAILKTRRCRAILKGFTVTDGMICAGTGDRDVCAGDSGGPLTCEDATSRQKYLCGIISWGYSCEHKNEYKYRSPGVYTDVRKYHGWIQNHTIAQTIPATTPPGDSSNVSLSKDCGMGGVGCQKTGVEHRSDTIDQTTMLRNEDSSIQSKSNDCRAGEFRCEKSGMCVPNKFRCNRKADCGAGDDSDERNCPRAKCPFSKFVCILLNPILRHQFRYVKLFQ